MAGVLRVAALLTGLGLARAVHAQAGPAAMTGPAFVGHIGAWFTGGPALPFDIPILLLIVALVAWGFGLLAQRLAAPAALGELVAGLTLGALAPGLATAPGLDVLASVGLSALLFTAGLDAARLEPRRRTPSAYALGALAGSLLVVGALLWASIPELRGLGWNGAREVAIVALALAAGLVGTRGPNSRQPHVAALSTLPLLASAFVLATEPEALMMRVLGLAVLGVVVLAARAFFRRVEEALRGLGRPLLVHVALLVIAAHALIAVACGLPAALGAGAAGFTLGRALRTTPAAEGLADVLRLMGATLLAPFLFVLAGLRVPFNAGVLAAGIGLGLAAIAGRTAGVVVAGAAAQRPRAGTLALALQLVPRGAVAVYVPLLALTAGALSPDLYAATIVAVGTTLALEGLGRRLAERVSPGGGIPVARQSERTGVLVIGAGPLARRVAALFSGPVVLVDRNERNARLAEADGLVTVEASALDAEALREAGAGRTCYALTLTGNPQLNRAVGDILRTSFAVPNVLEPDLSGRAETGREDGVLFGGGFALGDWEYHAAQGHVRMEEAARLPDRPAVPTAERLPVGMRRGELVLPFYSGLSFQEGDRVLSLIRTGPAAEPSRDRFDALVRTCPVLDLDDPTPMVMFFDRVASLLGPRLGMEPERLSVRFMQREADAGTVVLPGLAIPHVTVPGEGAFEMVIARARGGIQFPEREPVRAAFVLVSTADERAFHLRSLSAIAHAVQHEGFEERWAAAPDAEALRALLLER